VTPPAALVDTTAARTARVRLGVVAAAEGLARVRGHAEVFAHTRNPEFFSAIGYECVDRGLYPEKRDRAQSVCVRRAFGRGCAVGIERRDGMRQAA